MAKYSHRKYLQKQKQLKQGSRTGTSARKRAWIGTVIIVFLILGSLGFAFPQSFTAVGIPGLTHEDFRLGLDLQGGTHLVYEADMSQIPFEERDDALQGVRDVIERRVNAFGVSEPVVQTINSGNTHRVVVELAGVLDVNEAINQIGETPILEFKEPGESRSELNDEEKKELDTAQVADRANAQSVLEEVKTNDSFGEYSTQTLENVTHGHPGYSQIALSIINDPQNVGDYFITETGEGLNVIHLDSEKEDVQWLVSQIMVCFEGKSNCQDPIPAVEGSIRINQAADGLTPDNFASRAKEFSTDPSAVDNEGDLSWVQPGLLPSGLELAIRGTEAGEISGVVESEYGYHVFYVREVSPVRSFRVTRHVVRLTSANDIAPLGGWINTGLSGKQLKSSAVEFEQTSGEPIVTLNFDGEGGDLFAEMTSRLVGQQIAIFLDGEVISAPVVQQPIYGGTAQVSGNFTVDEAKLLSQRLNAGALPVPIDLLSQQTVGPTLGSASLERSFMAGMIGFILVALFMILYYRLPGVLSVFALILYALMNLAAYKLFGITITLAGIAGFILSVGMAVDANVLIFERVLEELKSGRDLPRAIEEGFIRAWTSIRDGNVTTLIAAGVLFMFSTSFIKGFAVTLTIGVLLSMFSAIVVTRTLLRLVGGWKFLRAPILYGVRKKTDV